MNTILSFFAKILIFLHIITPIPVPSSTPLPSSIPTSIPVVSQQPTPTPQVIYITVTPKPIIKPTPTLTLIPTPCVIDEEERYALEVIETLKIRLLTSYEQTKLNGTYRDIITRNDPIEMQNLIKQLGC